MMRAALLIAFTGIVSLHSVACAAGGRYTQAKAATVAQGPGGGGQPSTTPPADPSGSGNTMAIPEQLVIEGTLYVEVDEIGDLMPAFHTLVDGLGGRIVNENVSGAETSWSAQLKVRVPPAKVEEVVAFLGKRGEITSKNISATDVSKQMFDQELAIKNLRTTLDRLTVLMQQPGLNVSQILEVEKEMTRVRGQIDQLEGDNRFLKDRVGLATLDISLSRKDGAVTVAQAKAYPGARFATLVLFDPGSRARTRIGGGFVLHTVLRNMTLEVDIFRKELDAEGNDRHISMIATMGGATYSDFLGKGKRAFLNPYMGLRLGYAYLDGSRFVIQGEAGVELFKSKYVMLDANVRASGLIGSEQDMALVAGAGAVFAF